MKHFPVLFLIVVFSAGSALAQLYNASAPQLNANGTPVLNRSQCDSVCTMLVDGGGKFKGLGGQTGWLMSDDQWCANHGAQTNPLITAQPLSSTPGSVPNEACSVQMRGGDSSCSDNQQRFTHCTLHNGQLEQQCQAYVTANDGKSGEKVVLFLDIAAAGSCGVACLGSLTNPSLLAACRISSTAAGVGELIEVLKQKSDAVSKAISGAGAAYGLYSQYGAMKAAGGAKEYFSGGTANGTTTAPTAPATDLAQAETPAKEKQKDGEACKSAMIYAMMTLMRFQAIESQSSAQDSACQSVLSLASQSNTISGSSLLSLSATGGSSAPTVSSGSSGISAANNSTESALRCVSSGGSVGSCTGQNAAAATDGGMLSSSGLAPLLAPTASQIANSPLGKLLGEGQGDPSQAIGAAAAGSSGGSPELASTVISAANAMKPYMSQIMGQADVTQLAGGGGGAARGHPGSGENSTNPMAAIAALLGGTPKEEAISGTGMQVFRAKAEAADIWHSHTRENLFEIVSRRIEKVSLRIR